MPNYRTFAEARMGYRLREELAELERVSNIPLETQANPKLASQGAYVTIEGSMGIATRQEFVGRP